MRGLVAMLGCFAAGCLGPSSHPCSSTDQTKSWLCPANLSCAQAPTYCGAPGLIEQCNGKPEFEPCTYSDSQPGSCHGGICVGCTPDLEGCPTNGWAAMDSGVTSDLHAVWAAGRGDVFAGGLDSVMLHYDGLSWTPQAFPTLAVGTAIDGIWGRATNDVYAIAGSKVYHWNGTIWAEVFTGPQALLAITGAGSVVTASGLNGTIAQFDGTMWTATEQVLTYPAALRGAWADSGNVFAAGNGGLIVRNRNNAWETSRPAPGPILDAIWGVSGDDVYAVGEAGGSAATIFHYNGSSWILEPFTLTNLTGVWGSGPADVFACGPSGTIGHRDGSTWTLATSKPSNHDLRAIAGSSSSDVFAVGLAGTIWRYAGM